MNFPDLESELLIRCCMSSATGSAAIGELAARGVEWDRFLALANRNGITAIVGARPGRDPLPPNWMQPFLFLTPSGGDVLKLRKDLQLSSVMRGMNNDRRIARFFPYFSYENQLKRSQKVRLS